MIKAVIQGAFVGVLGSILLAVFATYIPEQNETLVFWVFFVITFIVIDYVIPNPSVSTLTTKIRKIF